MEHLPTPESEKPKEYRTVLISKEVLETLPTGKVVEERVVECNGINHRKCIDHVYYDEQGEL